jgi:hypothetical protein
VHEGQRAQQEYAKAVVEESTRDTAMRVAAYYARLSAAVPEPPGGASPAPRPRLKIIDGEQTRTD